MAVSRFCCKSSLVQVMLGCQMAPSHYLNQWWLLILFCIIDLLLKVWCNITLLKMSGSFPRFSVTNYSISNHFLKLSIDSQRAWLICTLQWSGLDFPLVNSIHVEIEYDFCTEVGILDRYIYDKNELSWPCKFITHKTSVVVMTFLIKNIFTRGQFWPSGIVVACVCLCVCPSVCASITSLSTR